MTCTSSSFNYNLNFSLQLPQFGIQFGNVYGVGGSYGIVDAVYTGSFSSGIATFTTCGLQNFGSIAIPVAFTIVGNGLTRASGLNELVNTQDSLNLTASGVIVLSAPYFLGTLHLDKTTVDAFIVVNGSNAVNDLSDYVPMGRFLDAFGNKLEDILSANVRTQLTGLQNVECTLPVNTNQPFPPTNACNPCDLRCSCFIQQSCNVQCLGYSTCAPSSEEVSFTTNVISFLAFSIVVLFVWHVFH